MDQKGWWEASGMATVAPPISIWHTGVVSLSARRVFFLLFLEFTILLFLARCWGLGKGCSRFLGRRKGSSRRHVYTWVGRQVGFKTHSTRLRWMGSGIRRTFGKCSTEVYSTKQAN
ncbi:hypothetical protein CABS01_10019 [Colletotrichum abscissum]|uniref:uncharacterized protein n=1 Tax=Colletotrichum abscissum TaxID=1671311 RepID=UPI0027D68D8F|nr:uncharacterized protein CABS01_10019 [Colletotrichum abscissum]KAK1500295.1 hypothetical protein CABS01_10019 [Colletotrichum abscissum]